MGLLLCETNPWKPFQESTIVVLCAICFVALNVENANLVVVFSVVFFVRRVIETAS